MVALLLLGAPPVLAKPTLSCGLTRPAMETSGSKLQFRITLDCSGKAPGSRPFPSQPEVLVGLTAYKPLPGNAKSTGTAGRKIITDDNTPSFDLPAQRVPLPKSGASRVVTFQANTKDLAGKTHWLFAAWPLSALQPCESKETYARSGCRRYGYVLVSPDRSDDGIEPLASYPGLVIDESTGNRKARWIVEKFR
ncbi:hypothetical protein KBY92_06735 [Synechococcus sp. Cruz CV-v-12]|nr:hypothetical protein [Synechococcus sp. Cruz CV-v-12]